MTHRSPRRLLGRTTAFGVRQKVYLVDEGLEIDEADHGWVERKRVFFDDVLAVTRHSILGWQFLAGMGCVTAFLLAPAIALLFSPDGWPAMIFFGPMILVFVGLIALRLVLRLDVVTVYGKRGKAELTYWFRKRRADETFRDLCERTRATQEKLAASRPAATAPPVPPGLTPPSEATAPAE